MSGLSFLQKICEGDPGQFLDKSHREAEDTSSCFKSWLYLYGKDSGVIF